VLLNAADIPKGDKDRRQKKYLLTGSLNRKQLGTCKKDPAMLMKYKDYCKRMHKNKPS
jgi:hypothetical protein